MQTIDLDLESTWPSDVLHFLSRNLTELRDERRASRDYARAGFEIRIQNGSPLMSKWNEAEELIRQSMCKFDFRAYHATRLLASNQIMSEGLIQLNIQQRYKSVKLALSQALGDELQTLADRYVEDNPSYIKRQGSIWLTPLKRLLNDGRCDRFFENFGGEAIEIVAGTGSAALQKSLKELGRPCVVVCRIPVEGWCQFAQCCLPKSLIEIYVSKRENKDPMDAGWDVMLKRDLPSLYVEAVLDRQHVQ